MSSILPVIFVWFISVFCACLGVIIGGTTGGIVGAITGLITKSRCTMRVFNVATFTSLLMTVIFFIVAREKIQPLNCDDGLEEVYICLSPLFIPLWGAIFGGIFGSFIGVLFEINRKKSH
ncbi:MAG: hypothetical protein MK289_01535 [Trichodesmium sp. ALOHA_ZT_67]|nr:hypothetical protein [Trichodesmium sp. ALOHA_ZT_67]MDE5094622.1 hypothetical protein [Trichodesmium sp. St11_bin5]MDT9339246.1 hypothetical protein [Trichodesmium erythraeum 21-75]